MFCYIPAYVHIKIRKRQVLIHSASPGIKISMNDVQQRSVAGLEPGLLWFVVGVLIPGLHQHNYSNSLHTFCRTGQDAAAHIVANVH